MSYDIFISYRRNGGEHTAKIIRDRLVDLGYNVFFDVESLQSGNFNTKIYSVIDECSDFILVLSPNALDRCSNEQDWIRREVEYALSKNKNIIPIMLRDFKFDTVLPESMSILPQLNGIEANSEFFDAFIKKLQKFLKAKPAGISGFFKNMDVKKFVSIIFALVLFAGAVFGIKAGYNYTSKTYPLSSKDKNLTQEVVYAVSTNLTKLELIAGNAIDAIEKIERHLYIGYENSTELRNRLDICKELIMKTDGSENSPDKSFADRLNASPFPAADVIAMYAEVSSFKSDCLNYIENLEYIASDSCPFPLETKVEIVSLYKKLLEEYLNMYACLTNQIFVVVTNESALTELYTKILPTLVLVPLDAQNWSTDIDVLKSKEDGCYEKMEAIIYDLTLLTGEINSQSY